MSIFFVPMDITTYICIPGGCRFFWLCVGVKKEKKIG